MKSVSHGFFCASMVVLVGLQHPLAQADALTDDMKARFEKALPGVSVRVGDRDQLHLREGDKDVGIVDLGNLREYCRKQSASACENQKQRLTSSEHLRPDGGERQLAPQSVRPIVRPVGFRAAIQKQVARLEQGKSTEEKRKMAESLPMLNDLGPHFVVGWAEDSANSMSPISASRMKSAGLTTSDLDRLGAANLRQEKPAPLEPAGAKYPGIFATHGNDYLSSVLLNEEFWKRVAGAQAGKDLFICLPARDELYVYVPALDTTNRIDFVTLCHGLARDAAPMFSDHVVRRVGQKWLLN